MDNRHFYRLPTEAEWEFAARGGLEDLLYSWGNLPDGTRMNFADATWNGPYSLYSVNDGYKFVSPVLVLIPPNNFGLYDMAGNVWEWVADYQHK